MDLAHPTHRQADLTYTSRKECLRAFDESVAKCRAALAAASDDELAKPWKFSFGEYLISNDPRSLSYRRMFFNHFIHHRAQLGVYLRLNERPVPPLYGPSADEQWSPS